MKPGTFTQLYIQFVFSPKNKSALLIQPFRTRIFEYMGGIVSNLGHKSIIINGTTDHVHLFIGLNPKISISDTVHEIKRGSSLFINENKLLNCKFEWQNGYGAFSYSRSHIDTLYNYIKNQEAHHQKRTFREEYLDLLKKYDIEFDDQYLFEFFDD